MEADTKPCPVCGEVIKTVALKCRFCNTDLSAFAATKEAEVEKDLYVGHPAMVYSVGQVLPCADIRVIDAGAGQQCHSNEAQLTWNQQGPKGDKGWSQAHFDASEYVKTKVPGVNTLVVEALDAACPFQGIVAPASRPARVDPFMGFEVDYPPFQTPDELGASSATGEVFINGQGADTKPRAKRSRRWARSTATALSSAPMHGLGPATARGVCATASACSVPAATRRRRKAGSCTCSSIAPSGVPRRCRHPCALRSKS